MVCIGDLNGIRRAEAWGTFNGDTERTDDEVATLRIHYCRASGVPAAVHVRSKFVILVQLSATYICEMASATCWYSSMESYFSSAVAVI